MGLREVAAALRRSWWLIGVCLLVGALLAFAVSQLTPRAYTSHARFFVSTTDGASTDALLQGSAFSEQRVTSYAQLLTGEALARRVIDRLNLHVTPQELAQRVTATAIPNTVLIDLSVSDSSAAGAQNIAQALSVEFVHLVDEVETPNTGAASPVKVSVIEAADLPDGPSSPQPLRDTATGLVLGLLIGVLAAIARVRLDRSVKDPEEAALLVAAPVIGTVVRDERLATQHALERGSRVRVAEDYRQLRTNLQFLNVDSPPQIIMVTSPMPGEGKTTAAINLALAMVEAGRKVTLVDADLRRPRVTSYLHMVGGVGLTNVLAGTADTSEVTQAYSDSGLTVIGAGPTPPNPSELLASNHMLSVIEALRATNDYILIDAPPLLPVADATGLAVMVDGVLLSVRYGGTRKDQLGQASATLERVGARTLGLILNIVPPKASIAAAYGYGYVYEDDAKAGRHKSGD